MEEEAFPLFFSPSSNFHKDPRWAGGGPSGCCWKKNITVFLYTQLMTLLTRNVCIFFPTLTSSLTLAGCPTIQFNSDTVCLEIASDPRG